MRLLLCVLCGMVLLGAESRKPLLQQPPIQQVERTNLYDQQPAAAKAGRKLFERECSTCHGKEGQGTSRAPSLLTRQVKQASPGALQWVLRNGEIRQGMPSFAHLPEEQRWQIVTYLKTLP